MNRFGGVRTVVILAGGILAVFAAADLSRRQIPGLPATVVRADSRGIVGTWNNSVVVNGQPFANDLITFNPGGTLIDTLSIAHNSQNPAFAGTPLEADFSDGFGTWKHMDNNQNQFAITFKRFAFAGADTPVSIYGSFFPGENVGVVTIEAVATLASGAGGDTLSGPVTFQITNLQGQQVFEGSATFSATRLVIEPLQ